MTARSASGRVFDRRKWLLRESRWCAAYRELPVGNPINGRAPRLSAAAPRPLAPRCIRDASSAVGGPRLRGMREVWEEVNAFRLTVRRDDIAANRAIPRITIRKRRGGRAGAFPSKAADPETRAAAFCAHRIPPFSPAESYQMIAIPGSTGIPRMLNRSADLSLSERRGTREFVRSRTQSGNPRIRFIAIESLEIANDSLRGVKRDTADSLFAR